ncbi:MAG TPA: adenylate/guanylate cyclase domain-containing protein, partial [Candidatus Kryptonia bacterium]|nr:adenylate/guanylate cyclase domain-containing protein [Candidatus Kryptonia bacterium]
ATLSVACPACGGPAEAGERFCGGCGAQLQPSAPAIAVSTPAPEPDAALPAGERRHLTVLFSDLVGSTPLSQQLDAEEWRDVVSRYHRTTSEAVEKFGGHVAKNLGDGLLIYFGWPTAREDDPERAVRAGLAIVEAVRALNERLLPSPPPLPEVATEEGTGVPSSASISASGGGLGRRPH